MKWRRMLGVAWGMADARPLADQEIEQSTHDACRVRNRGSQASILWGAHPLDSTQRLLTARRPRSPAAVPCPTRPPTMSERQCQRQRLVQSPPHGQAALLLAHRTPSD